MGQVHHGSVTDHSDSPSSDTNGRESLRALAKRYGINQKTVSNPQLFIQSLKSPAMQRKHGKADQIEHICPQ